MRVASAPVSHWPWHWNCIFGTVSGVWSNRAGEMPASDAALVWCSLPALVTKNCAAYLWLIRVSLCPNTIKMKNTQFFRYNFSNVVLFHREGLWGTPKIKDAQSAADVTILEFSTYWLVSGPWFNIKMTSYQYRKIHCGDKTILRPSYLHNGISYTDKMTSLYWIKAHIIMFYRDASLALCPSNNSSNVSDVEREEETRARLTKTYDVTIQRYRNAHAKNWRQ